MTNAPKSGQFDEESYPHHYVNHVFVGYENIAKYERNGHRYLLARDPQTNEILAEVNGKAQEEGKLLPAPVIAAFEQWEQARSKVDKYPVSQVNFLKKASQFKEAADKLSDRILAFEMYLRAMRGRCQAAVETKEISLSFQKDGEGLWRLFYTDGSLNEGRTGLLHDATVRIKLLAIRLFPQLLEAMIGEHEKMVEQIQTSVREHDDFMAELKKPSAS